MKGYWENLRPFEKRVFVGVTSGFFILFNAWFVFPHFGDWAKVQARMAAAQKKLTTFQATINQAAFYDREVKKLEGEGLSVAPEDQTVQFIRGVQTQATQSRVNVQNWGRQQFATNQFFLELSQNIGVLSGESELVDFLYHLGSSNSLIRVRDLTLKPDVPRQQLISQIKLVASYQKKVVRKAPAAAPPAKSPSPATKTAAPATKQPAGDAKSAVKSPPPAQKSSTQTNKPATSPPKKP